MTRRLLLAPSVDRRLGELAEGVAAAIVELITGPLLEAPTTIGKPLRRELEGFWSARRGAYRVVYRISDDVVEVVRIEHRSDAYRRR